jgi:uroporphyrinogen decarboxylase
LFPLCSHNWNVQGEDIGDYYEYVDEWNFTQHFPKNGGHYWSLIKSPVDGMMADKQALDNYQWPFTDNPERIAGLRDLAIKYRNEGKIVMVKSLCAGLFEMGQRIRGMENFLCDLLADKDTANFIMDNILNLKKKYWKMVIDEFGDVIDIVVETDDYGTQESQLVSFDIYKDMIEPKLRELVEYVKGLLAEKKAEGEKGYFFLHSCGNVRPLLPSFIDMGVDIINPVHITAEGMAPESLKADFGDKVTFWGGGIETQNILPNGTVDQVRENVRKNVEILKQGGGYVFNTVHNIQSEVPPENIVAMWETLQEYGC